MKSVSFLRFRSPGCLLAAIILAVHSTDAQMVRRPATGRTVPEAGADSDIVRIRKLTGLGSKGKIRTPVYNASSSRATLNPPGYWVQITVEYSTAADWTDELVFQYYVMTEGRVEGQKEYSFYRTSVRYGDIKRGTRHFSTVFLKPNTIERYGEPIGIAVEVLYGGKVVATESDIVRSSGLPDGDWWKNPKVTDSKAVKTRPGYLLNRSETPFAFLDMDDYETIR